MESVLMEMEAQMAGTRFQLMLVQQLKANAAYLI